VVKQNKFYSNLPSATGRFFPISMKRVCEKVVNQKLHAGIFCRW